MLMDDRSRRSSLGGSLNCGKTSTSANIPSKQFHPNVGLQIYEGNKPARCLIPSHEGQMITVLQIFNSMPNSNPNPE